MTVSGNTNLRVCPECGERLRFVTSDYDPTQYTGIGCVSCDWVVCTANPMKKKELGDVK